MAEVTTLMVGLRPRIAVDVCGSGPGVIFLHGIGGNRTNWRGQLALFGETFKAVALDFRGYGASDAIEAECDFHDFARDALRVLDYLELANAHWVGLSMGGLVAQAIYAGFPERVRSLTLIACRPGSAPNFPGEANASFLESRLAPIASGGAEALAASLLPNLVGPDASPAAREQIRASLAALRADMYIKVLKARVALSPFLDLSSIMVPTLIMGGGEDRVASARQMRELAAAVPGSRLAIAPRAGHLLNLEEPDFFNRTLANFLGLPQLVSRGSEPQGARDTNSV